MGIFILVVCAAGALLWIRWTCLTLKVFPFFNIMATEQIYYAVNIIVGIFLIVGAVVGLAQYIIASNQHKKWLEAQTIDAERRRTQKAIEMAGFYKDKILVPMSIILQIYNGSEIGEILKEIKDENMIDFDIHELNENLSIEKQKKIESIVASEDFFEIIAIANDIEKDCFKINHDFINKIKNFNNKSAEEKEILIKELYRRRFCHVISEVLNDLEFFAMYFVHNSADEKIVFQSLHQSYLMVMRALYFDISRNNKSLGIDKLFTHAIKLFNTWNKKVNEEKIRIIEEQRKANSNR